MPPGVQSWALTVPQPQTIATRATGPNLAIAAYRNDIHGMAWEAGQNAVSQLVEAGGAWLSETRDGDSSITSKRGGDRGDVKNGKLAKRNTEQAKQKLKDRQDEAREKTQSDRRSGKRPAPRRTSKAKFTRGGAKPTWKKKYTRKKRFSSW